MHESDLIEAIARLVIRVMEMDGALERAQEEKEGLRERLRMLEEERRHA